MGTGVSGSPQPTLLAAFGSPGVIERVARASVVSGELARRGMPRDRWRPAADPVCGYFAGLASPMRCAVTVLPDLVATTWTRSLGAIWLTAAAFLSLRTLVAGSVV